MTEILNIVTKTISQYLCKKTGFKKTEVKTGTVTLIQRFGGSINLNIHFHQLFLDGVYELDQDKKPIRFHITKAPSHDELNLVLKKIIQRIIKLLEKRGLIIKDEEDSLHLNITDDIEISSFKLT